MNTISLIGRLCADPELRRTQDGTAVVSYRLAVRRPHTKDTTDFHNVVTWRQGAEFLSQYAHKGDQIAVSGYLTNREWTDKEGAKRTTAEINADTVEIVSSKKADAPQQTQQQYQPPQQYQQPKQASMQLPSQRRGGNYDMIPEDDDELPF